MIHISEQPNSNQTQQSSRAAAAITFHVGQGEGKGQERGRRHEEGCGSFLGPSSLDRKLCLDKGETTFLKVIFFRLLAPPSRLIYILRGTSAAGSDKRENAENRRKNRTKFRPRARNQFPFRCSPVGFFVRRCLLGKVFMSFARLFPYFFLVSENWMQLVSTVSRELAVQLSFADHIDMDVYSLNVRWRKFSGNKVGCIEKIDAGFEYSKNFIKDEADSQMVYKYNNVFGTQCLKTHEGDALHFFNYTYVCLCDSAWVCIHARCHACATRVSCLFFVSIRFELHQEKFVYTYTNEEKKNVEKFESSMCFVF